MPRGIYQRKPRVDHNSLVVNVIKATFNGNARRMTPTSIKRIESNLPRNVTVMLDDIQSVIRSVDKITRGSNG